MDSQSPSFMQKYKFTIISLVIILIAAIPLLLLSKKNSTKMAQQTTKVISPYPTTEPLTPQNADAVFEKKDTDLQQTLNQVDTDLNAESKVDASQDSTTGL